MKIIFLDIDGVLNIMSPSYNTATYRKVNFETIDLLNLEGKGNYVVWMDYHLVQRLNWLIKKTGAKVVISSSWRLDMEDLQEQLKRNGFIYWDEVIGETPYFGHRGLEIQKWLDENKDEDDPLEAYVVLEDEVIDVCGSKCDIIPKAYVIEVNMKEGLSHKDVDTAKEILNRHEYNTL